MSCSINELKSHSLLTCKNFWKFWCFPIFLSLRRWFHFINTMMTLICLVISVFINITLIFRCFYICTDLISILIHKSSISLWGLCIKLLIFPMLRFSKVFLVIFCNVINPTLLTTENIEKPLVFFSIAWKHRKTSD